MAHRVMLIRHAENPSGDGTVHGVDESGLQDTSALSVVGWQRAGALARFFCPLQPQVHENGISRPQALFAPNVCAASRSRRSEQTLLPLSRLLSLDIRTSIGKGHEQHLAETLRASQGVVLACWSHQGLPAIARALAGGSASIPAAWPEDRFDIVWTFDFAAAEVRFRQIAQRLLPGDRDTPIG